MGVKEAWKQETVRTLVKEGSNFAAALQLTSINPEIVFIDGGIFYKDWLSSVAYVLKTLEYRQFRSGDFVHIVEEKAACRFDNTIQDKVATYARHVKTVVVVWDNHDVVAYAKEAETDKRSEARKANKRNFLSLLKKIIDIGKIADEAKFRHLLAKAGKSLFGHPPLPVNVILEQDSNTYSSWRGVTHIKAHDEADLTIARAEAEGQEQMVVISEDSDFLSLVNCDILRPITRGRFEVICGFRSAYEVVLAQMVGHDYTAGVGIEDVAWITARKRLSRIDEAQHAVDPIQLFHQYLAFHPIEDESKRDAVIQGITVWWMRSHQGAITILTEDQKKLNSSRSLRREACQLEATSTQLEFGQGQPNIGPPHQRKVKPSPHKQRRLEFLKLAQDPERNAKIKRKMQALQHAIKKECKKVSKRRGRESHRLHDYLLYPTQREIPQRIINAQLDDNIEAEAAARLAPVKVPDPATREPLNNAGGRRDLGQTYPRRTRTNDLKISLNCFGVFSQSTHPLVAAFQARVLAFKSACRLLSDAIALYMKFVFSDTTHHHRIAECFKSNYNFKNVIRAMVLLFTQKTKEPTRPSLQDAGVHIDLTTSMLSERGRSLEAEERRNLATRSKHIDYVLICVRRELERLGMMDEFPQGVLLFTDEVVNKLVANLELKLRILLEKSGWEKIKYQFPLLSHANQMILVNRLFRDEIGSWKTLRQENLPLGVHLGLFQEILQLRDYSLVTANAKVPQYYLNSGSFLPIAFCIHTFFQNSGVDIDQIALNLDPGFWSLSGASDLRNFLRTVKQDMQQVQAYNHRAVWSKSEQAMRLEDNFPGLSPTDIRWHRSADWEDRCDEFVRLFLTNVNKSYKVSPGEVINLQRLEIDYLGFKSIIPTIFLLDCLFRSDRLPQNQILSGVIATDGYLLSLGTLQVDRGYQTKLSFDAGASNIVDILFAEGRHSTLLGIKTLPKTILDGTAPPSEIINAKLAQQIVLSDLRMAFEMLDGIRRLSIKKQFIPDYHFQTENETRRGLPKFIKRARDFEWNPTCRPSFLIGVDAGEVRENKIVCGIQPPGQEAFKMSDLEFLSKPNLNKRALRAVQGRQLRRDFPLDLTSDKNATNLLFDTSPAKKQHESRIAMEIKARYNEMVLQTMEFLHLNELSPLRRMQEQGFVLLGDGYTPRKGVAVGSGNAFLRTWCKVLRRHYPKIVPLLVPEPYTSKVCPNIHCVGETGKRSLLSYPRRDKLDWYRLLFCQQCGAVYDRDTSAGINMPFQFLHIMLYDEEAWLRRQ